MRVGVLGAGAVGGAIAALLARGGHEVEVTARGAQLTAIRERGIHLTGAWGDYTAHVHAGAVLARGPELAIVATKAQDAAAAIADNAAMLRGIPVVVVQNGLSGIDAAVAAAPRSDIVGGLALFAASYLKPGEVRITTGGPLYLGSGNGAHDLPARYAAGVLGAVLEVTVVANFAGAQWTKLVVNQLNALPAITGLSAQEAIALGGLRRIRTASIRENVRVARGRRIRFTPLNGLNDRLLRLVATIPLWAGQLLPLVMRRRMGPTPNPGSTQQSIRRGQLTEIDYLNGAVVDAAVGTGVRTPVNAALVELVHEVERTGMFLSPAEVVARVPLR
ncbi:MAG: ketopantoate reductase family protein [Lacisediminihabitans sp.]